MSGSTDTGMSEADLDAGALHHLEAINEMRQRYRVGALPIWVVFDRPREFPGKVVVRCQVASERGVYADARAWLYDSLDAAREPMARAGLTQFPSVGGDEAPHVVETWL